MSGRYGPLMPVPELFAEIAGLLHEMTGESVAPDATLEGDLGLDSLDVAELAVPLRDRYGIDLVAFLASLDVDRLVALTAGELTDHVAAVRE